MDGGGRGEVRVVRALGSFWSRDPKEFTVVQLCGRGSNGLYLFTVLTVFNAEMACSVRYAVCVINKQDKQP